MARAVGRLKNPIVCGTDFTEPAARAANVAAGLAIALQRPLLLVHVTPAGPRRDRTASRRPTGASDDLRREATRLRARGATVVAEVHQGHADEVLAARSRATAAALVVVGALGTRQPARGFLGKVAERTAEGAQVPTLVVRDHAPFEEWLKNKRALRVLLGYDFTVTAEAAADWLQLLARAGRCEVTVGHASSPRVDRRRLGMWSSPATDQDSLRVREAIEQQILHRLHLLGGGEAHVLVRSTRGRIDLDLVGMAVDAKADLVLVGSHQRRGIERLWAGSVSRGVLHAAPMSVAVVPVVVARDPIQRIPTVSRVLVATDLSASAPRVIAYACAVARAPGVVRMIHVTSPRSIGDGKYETALGRRDRHVLHVRELGRRLEALRPAAARDIGLDTEAVVVECADAARGVCEEAERFDADIIVAGTKGGGVLSAVLGSVAKGIVAKSPRPVLVINPARQ